MEEKFKTDFLDYKSMKPNTVSGSPFHLKCLSRKLSKFTSLLYGLTEHNKYSHSLDQKWNIEIRDFIVNI